MGYEDTTLTSILRRFIKEVEYAKSIDWILTKLTTTIDEIEEKLGSTYVEKFLRSPKLIDVMAQLSCYKDSVLSMIMSPRYRSLHKYIHIIEELLDNIQCREGQKLIEMRPSPPQYVREERVESQYRELEFRPYIVREIPLTRTIHIKRYRRRRISLDILAWLALAISIIMILLTLLS